MAAPAAELHVLPHATTGGWTLDAAGNGAGVVRDPERGRAGRAAAGRARARTRRSTCTIATTASAAVRRGASAVAQDRLLRRAPRCRAARRPSGSVVTSSRPIRISRPCGHGRVEDRPGRRADAVMQARVGMPAASSTTSISSAIATASAAFSERGSTSTRRTWTPATRQQVLGGLGSRAVHTPASIPIPRAASTSGQLAPALLAQVQRDEVGPLGPLGDRAAPGRRRRRP